MSPNASHESTVQHILLMYAKVEKLNRARGEAQEQLIHRLADDYRNGRITAADVYAARVALQGATVPGFKASWDAAMPHELHYSRIVWTAVRYAPDTDGNWRGEYPFTDASRTPTFGVSVVYVLFDEGNRPCYVGSTGRFRVRLSAHARDGKEFVRWLAYPCKDRNHAYELEDRLLREHKPYLNRRASR